MKVDLPLDLEQLDMLEAALQLLEARLKIGSVEWSECRGLLSVVRELIEEF